MTMADMVAFTDVAFGGEIRSREATQEDIDALMG